MRRIRFFFCFFLILILFFLPFILGGAIFMGVKGIIAGGVFAFILIVLISIGSESVISLAYGAQKDAVPGLNRTFDLAMAGRVRKSQYPRLLLYSDPAPRVLAARSLGRKGMLLLSRGAIATFRDEELQAVLSNSMIQLQKSDMVLQCLCMSLVLILVQLAPKAWVELVFANCSLTREQKGKLHPFSAILFLIFYPFIRFLMQFCPLEKGLIPRLQRSTRLDKTRDSHLNPESEVYFAAMQKSRRMIGIWGKSKNSPLL